MKFDPGLIVPARQLYKGRSYGVWAVKFWNWLFSDQTQGGCVYFLRGNVDNEPVIVKSEIIYSHSGLFFPIICTINSSLNYPSLTNSIERRKKAGESQRNPKLLRAVIDEIIISDLHSHYAETPEFILRVAKFNNLRMQFDPPIPPGEGSAVSAGYWVLLNSLPVGRHRIEFEGVHKDGFRTFGQYFITVKKHPK
jgi:hypothetical protein